MSTPSSLLAVAVCVTAMACSPPNPVGPASPAAAPPPASEARPAAGVGSPTSEGPISATTSPSASAAPPNVAPLSLAPPPPPSRATLNGVSLSEASVGDIQRAFEKLGWQTSVASDAVSAPVWQVGRYEQLMVRVFQRGPNGKESRAFAVALARLAKVAARVQSPADTTKLAPATLLAQYDSAILDLPYFHDERAEVLVVGLPIGMPSRDVKAVIDLAVAKPR